MANAIRAEVKRRLVGKTQAILARELGVSALTVHQALHGKVNPSPKLLKALGYRKVVTYEKVERATPCEPVFVQETHTLAVADPAYFEPHKFTPQLVQIALKHKLTPGVEWKRFLTSSAFSPMGDVFVAFEAWCKTRGETVQNAQGKAIGTLLADESEQALGAPGELYSHLKPIQRGPDHRPPPLMGNVHPVMPDAEPK